MDKLMAGMKTLAEQELRYARQDHGEIFNDFAQAYHALAEEMQEAGEDCAVVRNACEMLLRNFRITGKVHGIALKRLERFALSAACELVQVATVARKMQESPLHCDSTSAREEAGETDADGDH